jgi:hypothetical protein
MTTVPISASGGVAGLTRASVVENTPAFLTSPSHSFSFYFLSRFYCVPALHITSCSIYRSSQTHLLAPWATNPRTGGSSGHPGVYQARPSRQADLVSPNLWDSSAIANADEWARVRCLIECVHVCLVIDWQC